MTPILRRIRYRLLPALLTALGVALLATGLLSYISPVESVPVARPLASYRPLPTINDQVSLPGGSAVVDPSFPPDRVATRVVLRHLNIDLPIMLQTPEYGTYPLCDVAMYYELLGQPGEGKATYIYAHAREGMFLPLLNASERDGGKAIVGDVAEIYTSDNYLFLYKIVEVDRHVTELTKAFATTTERLFLQTSEGPAGTIPKLQVVADFVSAEKTDAQNAHPEAHPRICR